MGLREVIVLLDPTYARTTDSGNYILDTPVGRYDTDYMNLSWVCGTISSFKTLFQEHYQSIVDELTYIL